jgi:hypothetical protein
MSKQSRLLTCPDDIFLLILERCEQASLHNLSLTSRSLRPRCIPQLYREVDLSSHNLGRVPEFEDELRPEIYANTDDFWRPHNLVSRQRSSLRTMTECPEYATAVRVFSWTLIWRDVNEDALAEMDYQLWTTFSRLTHVTRLDLASLRQDEILDPYVRQMPSLLFPHVTELRLTGWMHHSLVANILNSIDVAKLQSLSLDALQEEGQIPDGSPMPEEINKDCWNSAWRLTSIDHGTIDTTQINVGIIFPGPMWSTIAPLIGKLESLQHLEIRIPPLETSGMDTDCIDHLHYIFLLAGLVASVVSSLKSLVIDYARDIQRNPSTCGTGRNNERALHQHRSRLSQMMLNAFWPCFSTEREWKWESLQSVSLRGFLQGNETAAALEQTTAIKALQMKIEDSLSSRGVALEWSNDSQRPAVLFMGYDFAISEEAMSQFVRLSRQPQLAHT